MAGRFWVLGAAVVALAVAGKVASDRYGWDAAFLVEVFRQLKERTGVWAIPVYILIHTVTLSLCLPYAIFFEAGASLLFGFFPGILCVFLAKVLGASLSFWIGRLLFLSIDSAKEWTQKNKYFHILAKGVQRDGWKFVLLARFSPMPSYVINYAMAALEVRFLMDFLFPTVIGCLPMILQNTSLGSLAVVAVASASGSNEKSQVWSYLFPLMGILSSILITMRIRKYSKEITALESTSTDDVSDLTNTKAVNGNGEHSKDKKKR